MPDLYSAPSNWLMYKFPSKFDENLLWDDFSQILILMAVKWMI